MALDFDKQATKGNEFLNKLAKELGYPDDKNRAGRVLRSVLYGLREQLTVEESVQLLAQLPTFLKGIYVENWTLKKKDKKPKHYEQFYNQIREFDKTTAQQDFPTDDDIDNATGVVFMALRKYISLGEFEDLKAVLPKDLKSIFNNVLMI